MSEDYEKFLDLSIALTGFERVDLLETGVGPQYHDLLVQAVGAEIGRELIDRGAALYREYRGHPEKLAEEYRTKIIEDVKLGPVALATVTLWYLGLWSGLPEDWQAQFGKSPVPGNQIPSPDAYRQGLVWRTAGTKPQGTRGRGFGYWALSPEEAR
jgi:hypothetical protein